MAGRDGCGLDLAGCGHPALRTGSKARRRGGYQPPEQAADFHCTPAERCRAACPHAAADGFRYLQAWRFRGVRFGRLLAAPTVCAFGDSAFEVGTERADVGIGPYGVRSTEVLLMPVPSGPMWASAPTVCVWRWCIRRGGAHGRIYNPPLRPYLRFPCNRGGLEPPTRSITRPQAAQNGAVSLRSNRPKKYEARLLRRVGLRRIIEV